MSVLTEVLKLFKYDPATDGDMTFNIGQCMNDNWDKLDAAILLAIAAAGAYNPEESYAVGDYCTYKGKLRKCSTAIPTGETWTEAHWTTTTVAAEMQELSSQLSNALKLLVFEAGEGNNLSSLPEKPFFCMTANTGITGLPDGWPQGRNDLIRFYTGNLVYALDLIAGYSNNRLAYRFANKDWTEIATATLPQAFDLPLQSGISIGFIGALNQYSKAQNNLVVISFSVRKTSGYFSSGDYIAILPAGFRPASYAACAAAYSKGFLDSSAVVESDGAVKVYVTGDGAMRVRGNQTDIKQIDGTLVYYADS